LEFEKLEFEEVEDEVEVEVKGYQPNSSKKKSLNSKGLIYCL